MHVLGEAPGVSCLLSPGKLTCTLHPRELHPSPHPTEGTSHLGKHTPGPAHTAVAPSPGCPSRLKCGQGKGQRFWTLDKPIATLCYQSPSWDVEVTLREAPGVTRGFCRS